MANKVVCRKVDGTLVKGFTYDFAPTRETFHVDREGKTVELRISELKAVFFVKSFEGREDYGYGREKKDFEGVKLPGKKVKIKFCDGEVLYGLTLGYHPNTQKSGFFVSPVDPQSNNIRIFAVSQAIESIEVL